MIDEKTKQDSSDGAPGATAKAQEHLQSIAGEAGAALDEAKAQGNEQYEHLRDAATEQIDSLAQSAHSAAEALEGNDSLGLSRYLTQMADWMGTFANEVRDQSAEQIMHRGARLARDNPTMFFAASVAVGFGVSRFLRASQDGGRADMPQQPAAASPPEAVDRYGATSPYQSAVEPLDPSPAARPAPDAGFADRGGIADPLGNAATNPDTDTFKGGAI